MTRYRARVSGPLLDRIDMHLEVPPVPHALLKQAVSDATPTSAQIRARVVRARERQLARDGKPAHQLASQELERSCALDARLAARLEQAATQLGLSARAYHRILKVARTIADLDGADMINRTHLGEGIGYRKLNRKTG